MLLLQHAVMADRRVDRIIPGRAAPKWRERLGNDLRGAGERTDREATPKKRTRRFSESLEASPPKAAEAGGEKGRTSPRRPVK